MKKHLAIVLLLVLALTSCLGLAACNKDAESVIQKYRLEQDGLTVTESFELPAEIGGIKATWKSSHPNLVKVESHRKADWTATVTRPESERTAVTLTLKLGGATREFVVYVNPVDVYDLQDSYAFPYEKAALTADIDLETSYTYLGKTATISWSVHEDSANYIAINEAGNKCIVTTPGDEDKIVQIKATFTYNGASTTKTYRMTIVKPVTHEEEVHKWYTNTGVSMDISGWVIAIAAPYDAQYGNVSIYVLDEDKCSGYYIYRGKCNAETGANLKVGSFITLTGSTNTSYEGLYETNANGTITIDKDKSVDDISKIEGLVSAIDNDLFSGTPATDYNMSRYVSLNNWTVKEVKTAPTKYDNADIMVLTKNGVDIAVRVSKYMAGSYNSVESAEWKALVGLCGTIQKDNVVTVKGILSKYKGAYQLLMVKASDLTTGTADPAETVYPGVTVKPVITAVKTALDEKLGALITSTTFVDLPASTVDGVALEYSIIGTSRNAVLNDAKTKLTVTPNLPETVTLKVVVTNGTYSTPLYYSIKSRTMTDAQMLEAEKESLALSKTEIAVAGSSVSLAQTGKVYDSVTIAWAKKNASDIGEIANNKLTFATLPEKDTEVVLVATLTCGDESDTKEVKVTVKAAKFEMTKVTSSNVQADKAYNLVIGQENSQKYLFAKNAMSGYYVTGVDALDSAELLYLEAVTGGGYKLYFKGAENAKTYIGAELSGSYKNIKLGADLTTVWTIGEDGKISTVLGEGNDAVTVYLCTWSSNNDFRVSDKATFPAFLAEVADKTPANVISITPDTLSPTYSEEVQAATVKKVAFAYVRMSVSKSGALQLSKASSTEGKPVSAVYNTTAFASKINAISLKFNGNTFDNSEVIKVEFATSADFANAKTVLVSTVKDTPEISVDIPTDGNYTFVRISSNAPSSGYNYYIDAITITLDTSAN